MKKRLRGLSEAFADTTLVLLNRQPIEGSDLLGYIVGLSERFLLLHVVDGSTLLLNGYQVVRMKDIRSFRTDNTFVDRYLRLQGVHPVVPEGIGLSSWPALFASVARQHPLLMIEREKKEPGVGLIGRIEKLKKRSLLLKKIEAKADWVEAEEFKFQDITCVGFADGYIRALEWLAAHDERKQQAQ